MELRQLRAFVEVAQAGLIEFGLAYRRDDPSPILANLLRTVEELGLGDASANDPKDGELV